MPPVTVAYFKNIRGRGEVARLLCVASGGQEGKDFEFHDVDSFSYASDPRSLLGQLPWATIDGIDFCQSRAIERALAAKFNLAGSTAQEKALVDMMCETVEDVSGKFVTLCYSPSFSSNRSSFLKATLPSALEKVEKLYTIAQFERTSGPFLLISGVTLADLSLFEMLSRISGFAADYQAGAFLDRFPLLKAAYEAVAAIPAIAEYLKSPKRAPRYFGPQAFYGHCIMKDFESYDLSGMPASARRGLAVAQALKPLAFIWAPFRMFVVGFGSGAVTSFCGLVAYGTWLRMQQIRCVSIAFAFGCSILFLTVSAECGRFCTTWRSFTLQSAEGSIVTCSLLAAPLLLTVAICD